MVVYARTATVHCVNTKTPPVFRPFSFTQPQRTAGLARQHRRVPYFCKGEGEKNFDLFLVAVYASTAIVCCGLNFYEADIMKRVVRVVK